MILLILSLTSTTRIKVFLPENHEELWQQSQRGLDGNRWTKIGEGKNAEYHRFLNDGNGNYHWNGSTNGMTKSGNPNRIKLQDVPENIR